ncbi:hypothetical protein [Paraburkholderia xenovorans]|jgi:hypothetical protein|uniref:hypothetical protein n=1 Tax=Paraburkholderia xenovorans TaxID=36873 RepID=UPI0015C53EDF|nr:hypothetical protein [Paraburkholderia xenovorans]NPT34217.1 hypothetical protein [Paraburkholderia xenovorans]
MSQPDSTVPLAGEPTKVKLTPEQELFIKQRAAQLDEIKDAEVLKHFTENWWNLCQWEKQRLDVIDTKAQMLLGLSSIATAILGTGFAEQSHIVRAIAAAFFFVTMALALISLFIRQVGGFRDLEVFQALQAFKEPVGSTPKFTDNDQGRCYYRELALQRWLVYDFYKTASKRKSPWVTWAQVTATLAVLMVALAVCFPSTQSQASNSTSSAGAAAAGSSASAPATSTTPAIGSTSASSPDVASTSTPASASTPTASPKATRHSNKKSIHHEKQ